MASWTDERFKYPRQIGNGAFGYVYKCIDALTHSVVAVKIIQFERKEGAVPREIVNEIAALQALNHPNVVRLILVKEEAKLVKIAMEYVDTDLGKYIKHAFQLDGVSVLDPKMIKRFLFEILRGIFHCHLHGIVHRDVKPDNLLLDLENNRIKIADFGHIRRADDAPPTETKTTTIQYNAPEILLRVLENTTAVDIWSVGCTFAEMLKGKPLFFGSMDYVVLRRIIRTFGVPSEQDWPGVTQACLNLLGDQMLPPRKWNLAELFADIEPNALHLLTSMLRFLPNERITAEEAMRHPYFDDLLF